MAADTCRDQGASAKISEMLTLTEALAAGAQVYQGSPCKHGHDANVTPTPGKPDTPLLSLRLSPKSFDAGHTAA
jgi:hypothetical protein